MKRLFADHYLPAELAGKSFLAVQVWLPAPPSLEMRQLYLSFLARLVPGADVAFCESRSHPMEDLSVQQNCLQFVAAELLPTWPANIPMLPLPEILNETLLNPSLASAAIECDELSHGVILFGPESTGKSTLSLWLANQLAAPVAKEYVRLWFDVFGAECSPVQAALIANVVRVFQWGLAHFSPKVWVADTDVLASWMWYEWYFGALPNEVDLAALCEGRVYLLMADDIAFEPDHQRRYADRREFDTTFAEQFLRRAGAKYCLVSGVGDARTDAAIRALKVLGIYPERG